MITAVHKESDIPRPSALTLTVTCKNADSLAGNPGPAGKKDSPSTKSHNLS